jgi:DMSO reductase anchor subunit
MDEQMVGLMGSLALMASLLVLSGFIFLVRSRERSRTADLQAETVRRLIDKLGTSQEAMAYLESESGRMLLEAISTPSAHAHPYRRILTAVSVGAVLFCVGVGLLILTGLVPDGEELIRGAVVLMSLGAGFLIAAGASYRLSKSWGLLETPSASTSRLPVESVN